LPETDSVSGEDKLGLRTDTVAEAAPSVLGVNHTWNIAVARGARVKPGEMLE
jgi:hypothetical protein